MWGSSFNDLAKKAAEMQEQAAASMTSPVAPSFSMGGMFNMDALQQKDENDPDKKQDDLKKMAQQAMSDANTTTSSSTFYNPMQQQQQQQQHPKPPVRKVQQPKQQPSPAKPKQQQQSQSPFLSSMNVNNFSMDSMTTITPSTTAQKAKPAASTSAAKNPSKNLFPAAPTAKPSLATPAKPTLSTPKGKLTLSSKPKPAMSSQTPNQSMSNNSNNITATNKLTTPGGGNTLKLKPPQSNTHNNTAPKDPKQQGGGLVLGGTSKSQALKQPATTLAAPKPAATLKQSTLKLTAPKPIPKQQSSASIDPFGEVLKAKPQSDFTQAPQEYSSASSSTFPAKEQSKGFSKPLSSDNDSSSPTDSVDELESRISAMKVVELKAELKSHGLSTTGLKKILQERLLVFLRTNTPQTSGNPSTGLSQAKPKQQQDKRQDPKIQNQQSAASVSSSDASVPPVISSSPAIGMERGPVGAVNKPVLVSSQPTNEKAAVTRFPSAQVPAKKEPSQNQPKSKTESEPDASLSSQNEGILREQLQQQKEQFEQKLMEQRQQMEVKMQQLQQQFSDQLQRLEEHHRHETESLNGKQKAALANWQQQVRDREILLQSQSQSSESNEMESQNTIKKLSYQLKQAKDLLSDKEKEDRRLQEVHLQQLRDMEKQCFKQEDSSSVLEKEIQNLKKKLEESNEENEKTLDEFNKLKSRAKNVAGELKERRAECRTLSSEIDLLESGKQSLEERITQLEATGMDMNQSSEETQEKLDSFQSSLDETRKELEQAREDIGKQKEEADVALSKYKKKAQQSLKLANARSASAVQAREEAEMEARAARATADTVMERSMKAELNGKQALAEAKIYTEQMKDEVAKYESVKTELQNVSKELKQIRIEAENHKDSNEKLQCELASLNGRLEAEQATMEDMKASLTSEQNRSNELYNEVDRLRNGSRRYQDEIKRLTEAKKKSAADTSFTEEQEAAIVRSANAEADATIAMLQQELQDSNQAIKGLKESLRAAMEENAAIGDRGSMNGNGATNGIHHHEPENNSMPLFYAMEKQAELSQARDEIARMANLLGDAESSRQDAEDEMHDMKKSMEDAQSKLQRQEQLQSKKFGEHQSLNIEYLKNIVLSYLRAETVEEKKALLPVVGTVLCLTQAEQMAAIEQLEKGNGSVMSTVTTSVLGYKWS